MRTLTVFLFATTFVLGGCGGGKEASKGEIGKEPVKTSGKKGDWVSDDRTYIVEDGRMKFRVMSDNEPDLSFAAKGLDGQAYGALVRAVKVRAGLEFDEAVKGSKYNPNSIGQARQEVINAIGDVHFSDLVKEREYWEQFEKNEGMGRISYVHTIYGLYSISEKELVRAKEEAWDKASEVVTMEADKDAQTLLNESRSRFLGIQQ